MLVNLKELLDFAEENKCAIGSFNFTSLESIDAIIKASEEVGHPVILSHAPVHDIFYGLEDILPIALDYAKRSKIRVCVHLDHGTNIDYIKKGILMGFTSVMYDGSSLPYDENVKNTKQVVEFAKKYNVSVEGELGMIMSNGMEGADDKASENAFHTDPDLATDYIKQTDVDCLAISFGTVHGEYVKEPNLDINVIKSVRNRNLKFPIVMHGGSGVSESDYKKVIDAGVRKINYYTYSQIAGYKGVKQLVDSSKTNYYHDVIVAAKKAMYQDYLKTIHVFSNKS
ncbi:class II fructose-bisphosphate aldolase [Mycoplasmatota bacterium]|nr:class II fructose-bisphosphate aldolase [Mycoplasmatota bacterium]